MNTIFFNETVLFKDNNREQSTNNKCTPRSCSPAQIYTESIPSTTGSLLPPNSRVLLLSREDCLPKTCTAREDFLSVWTLCKTIQYVFFCVYFFDSKLCLRFTHDVVYGNIFIHFYYYIVFLWMITRSIQVMAEIWMYFQFLTITNAMVQITMMLTFGKSIYYDFCLFNSWSFILIFLMVCCTSMSQVTHLRFDLSTFFLSM